MLLNLSFSRLLASLQVLVYRLLGWPVPNRPRFLRSLLGEPEDKLPDPQWQKWERDRLCSYYPSTVAYEFLVRTEGPELPLLVRCRIQQVSLMKKRSSTKPAYVLVYVTLDGGPWAVAENRVGMLLCEWAMPPVLINLTGVIPSRGPRDQFIVHDPDSYVGWWDDVAYSHSYDSSSAPPLSYLFAAAKVVHDDLPKHFSFSRQRYYYAMMLFWAMAGERAGEYLARPYMWDAQVVIEEEGNAPSKRISLRDRPFLSVFMLVAGADIHRRYAELEPAIKATAATQEVKLREIEQNWRRLSDPL